ncbi:MAG: hypothetical protein GEU78_14310 [Actinobacteria bacterium]|nr:hypothetical protein [Actinomycetota bacterium]
MRSTTPSSTTSTGIGIDDVSYRRATAISRSSQITTGTARWVGGRRARRRHPQSLLRRARRGEKGQLQAVSLDMGKAYEKATSEEVSHVTQCVDPFHVVQLANQVIDRARRWAWNHERRTNPALKRNSGRPPTGSSPPPNRPRWVKHTRWALLKDPGDLNDGQVSVLDQLRRERSVLYRCWQLKEALRDLYRLHRPQDASLHLDWWLAWACRSRIPSFVRLSKTIRASRDRVLAAVELGLSNSKLEGLNCLTPESQPV